MKKITIFLACFTILSFVNTAQAVSVNIPLNPSDWSLSPYLYQDASILTQTGTNTLRGTVLTGNGGSPYGMEVETNDTYNFQNATLRFQWRTNGLGGYSQSTTHLSSSDGNVSHNIANNGSNASFTTHHSWAGSQTIADDAWLYTEITYNPTGMDFSVSYTGYNLNPISLGTNLYTTATWDRLDDAMFRFRLVDNYRAGTYFELAELNLVTPVIPEAVPIPASIFLFGSALLGLFGFKSKSSLSA